jgi:hypothetical protein
MLKPTHPLRIHGHTALSSTCWLRTLQILLIAGFLGAQLGINPTVAAADTLAPAAPSNLVADVHGRVVDLAWSPSGEPEVMGYNVYRSSVSPVTLADPVNGSTPLSSPKYHDLKLAYGVRYFYVVTAVGASGLQSPASNEVSVTPTVDHTPGQAVPDGVMTAGDTAAPLTSLDTAGALATAPNGPVVVAPLNGATDVAFPVTLTVQATNPANTAMTVTFYGRQKNSVGAPNFTVIAVGDTQSYVLDSTGAAIFTGNMQWVANTQFANNIAYLVDLGDITMDGNNDTDNSEWNIASTAYAKLERGTPSDGTDDVPFGIVPGNHDNLGGGWARYENTFGAGRFIGRPYYGGHYGIDNTNNYTVFSASGMHFISIQLACPGDAPSTAVLNWADALLKADASRRGIVVCHSAMSSNSLSSTGAIVYNALRDNSNFFLLLAGHAAVGRWTGSGTDGHPIYAMMSDYTGSSEGWIRRIEFQPASNLISVKTYGPTTNGGTGSYKTTSADQFTVPYAGMRSPDFTLLGTVPNVASGSNASVSWPGLTSGTQYEWYAVASDGTSSTASSTSAFTTSSQGTTPTVSPTSTSTSAAISTPTLTPTPTITATSTATPTRAPTNTPTNTPTSTVTPTQTSTNTPTNTPTITATSTVTPTRTPTNTPTNTPTTTPEGTHTIVLQPDDVAGLDNYISNASLTNNFGTVNYLKIGEDDKAVNKVMRSLLKFDLSAIPTNATVTSSTLSLWLYSNAATNNHAIQVYRLVRPWSETTSSWNMAQTGSTWQAAGANGASDREANSIGGTMILANESAGEEQFVLQPARVQEMINGSFANNGFVLMADGELDDQHVFRSSDYSKASQRPKLVVQYLLTPAGTPTAVNTNTPTATLTLTSTTTPTSIPTNSPTATSISSPTPTNSPTATSIATATPTNAPTATNIVSNTPTNTPTATRIPTNTPTNTPTSTASPVSTSTATPTNSPTATPITTNTPTNTPTSTASPVGTSTPTPTTAPASDAIFADGFESGNLSAWSSSNTNNGALSVSPQAAMLGSYGLQVVINSTSSIYASYNLPSSEPQYRARFYFDPNSIAMTDANAHYLCIGYDAVATTASAVFNLDFRYSAGAYQVRLRQQDDSQATVSTPWVTITDAPHVVELQWWAATSAGANNGGIALWVDGVQTGSLSNLDNDTRRIERVRLGAASSVDAGTVGTYYIDAFESRRQTYIGP